MGRKQEDFSLPDGLTLPLTFTVDVLQDHVAFQLVEKLVSGVNVEVSASIWATDDHDHELGVFPNHLGSHRRSQQATVIIDPAFEVQCLKRFRHGSLLSYAGIPIRRRIRGRGR